MRHRARHFHFVGAMMQTLWVAHVCGIVTTPRHPVDLTPLFLHTVGYLVAGTLKRWHPKWCPSSF